MADNKNYLSQITYGISSELKYAMIANYNYELLIWMLIWVTSWGTFIQNVVFIIIFHAFYMESFYTEYKNSLWKSLEFHWNVFDKDS